MTTAQLRRARRLLGRSDGGLDNDNDDGLDEAAREYGQEAGGGRRGPESLSIIAQRLILRLLHDHSPLPLYEPPIPPDTGGQTCAVATTAAAGGMPLGAPSDASVIASTVTMAQAFLDQLPYLDAPQKIALLDLSSLLPQEHPDRLADQGVRAILSDPPEESAVAYDGTLQTASSDPESDTLQACKGPVPLESDLSSGILNLETADWDTDAPPTSPISSQSLPLALPNIARPDIRHLPLTLSSSPLILPLIRDIHRSPFLFPSVSLTSLDLAYSHIKDLERLVDVLPPALRELGLAGVTLGGAAGLRASGSGSSGRGAKAESRWVWDQEGLKRGLGALGRKMLVLKVRIPSSTSPHLDMSLSSALATLSKGAS